MYRKATLYIIHTIRIETILIPLLCCYHIMGSEDWIKAISYYDPEELDDNCDYESYHTILPHYVTSTLSYSADYKKLDLVYSGFEVLLDGLFRTDILKYIETIGFMYKEGTLSFNSETVLKLIEMQIFWFIVLVLLLLIAALLITATIAALMYTVLFGGRSSKSFMKVKPYHKYMQPLLGLILLVTTVTILVSSTFGMLGSTQQSNIISEWNKVTINGVNFIENYMSNITNDMKLVTDNQVEVLNNKLETILLDYTKKAADGAQQSSEEYAKSYDNISKELPILEENIFGEVAELKDELEVETIVQLIDEKINPCYKVLYEYCLNNDCKNVEKSGKFMEPEHMKTNLTEDKINVYMEFLEEFSKKMKKIRKRNVSDIIYTNLQKWESTSNDLLTVNKDVLNRFQRSNNDMAKLIARTHAITSRQAQIWIEQLLIELPINQSEYNDGSILIATYDHFRLVLSVMLSSSLGLALLCCALYIIGHYSSDDKILPTKRSDLSNFAGTGMQVAFWLVVLIDILLFILVIVFFVPATFIGRLCYEISELGYSPFVVWDANILVDDSLISRALGDSVSNITFEKALNDCKNNTSLYTALNLTNIWDLDAYFNIDEFLGYSFAIQNFDLKIDDRDSWFNTFFTENELESKIVQTFEDTNYDATKLLIEDIHHDIVVFGLVPLAKTPEDISGFTDVLKIISNSGKISSAQKETLENCTTDVDNIRSKQISIENVASNLVSNVINYNVQLNTSISLNNLFFFRTKSSFQSFLRAALFKMQEEVKCYIQVAKHCFTSIIGRCKPIYDLYNATKGFMCERVAKSEGIIFFACFLNCIVLCIFLVCIHVLIPLFKRMDELHPDDTIQIERERIAMGTNVGTNFDTAKDAWASQLPNIQI